MIFFRNADILELKRLCGLNYLTGPYKNPLSIRRFKYFLPLNYGSLNYQFQHHTKYHEIPLKLRGHPRISVLRNTKDWIASVYSYNMSNIYDELLLVRTAKLLVYDEQSTNETSSHLLKHKEEFRHSFQQENLSLASISKISLKFFIYFTNDIKVTFMLRRNYKLNSLPRKIGLLTFRAIEFLFDNPRKIFSMSAEEFDDYFASNRYVKDMRCEFLLNHNKLTEQLSSLMINELGYSPDIIMHLKQLSRNINASPKETRAKARRELKDEQLSAQVLQSEEIYRKYIEPLAIT